MRPRMAPRRYFEQNGSTCFSGTQLQMNDVGRTTRAWFFSPTFQTWRKSFLFCSWRKKKHLLFLLWTHSSASVAGRTKDRKKRYATNSLVSLPFRSECIFSIHLYVRSFAFESEVDWRMRSGRQFFFAKEIYITHISDQWNGFLSTTD